MKNLIPLFLIGNLIVGCSSGNVSRNKTITDTATIPPVTNQWRGTWERNSWQNDASLEITNIKSDSITFSLFASNGGHTGQIEGMAVVNGTSAIFYNEDEFDTCLIQFNLINDSIITIDQKYGDCFAAMAVVYDGDYKNSKYLSGTEPTEDLKSLGIFETKKEDSIFRYLVGNSYPLFVNSTQLTSEDDDLDGFDATVRSSGVRGLFTFMENIIMIDSSNNIWAAVIDDNKVYYFTNKQEYKSRLPKTINNWRQRFKEYPIMYK